MHVFLNKMQIGNGFSITASKRGTVHVKEKRSKGLGFLKPTTAGQMKQFVGLINTSMTFVNISAEIMKPLHDMIQLNFVKKRLEVALPGLKKA
jgi:hypothetical protein